MKDIKELDTLIRFKVNEREKLKNEIWNLKLKREEVLLNNTCEFFRENNLVKKYGMNVILKEDKVIIKDIAIYNDKKPSFEIEVYISKIYLPIESNDMNMVSIHQQTLSTRYWERPVSTYSQYYVNDIEAIKNRITKLLRKCICYRLQRINHDKYIHNERNIALFSKNYKERYWQN